VTNQNAQVSQVLALIVGDTPPFELDIASSVVEFLYAVGTPDPELQLSASVVEYLAILGTQTPADVAVDPVAQGFVPGPRWQMASRTAGNL
jgi:hypothetical protein